MMPESNIWYHKCNLDIYSKLKQEIQMWYCQTTGGNGQTELSLYFKHWDSEDLTSYATAKQKRTIFILVIIL